MVRCGIIGAGIMGELHAKACHQFAGSQLVALCDVNEEKAGALAERYHVTDVFTDYKKMLDSCDLDAVHVLTPDFAHRDPVVHALDAGKNVIVEKPMATTLEDAEQMRDFAKKSPGILMINFCNRWLPVYQHVKKAIVSSEIGTIKHIYCRISNTIDVPLQMIKAWSDKTSPTEFLLPHMVDLVRWFIVEEAEEVYAMTTEGFLKEQGVDTHDSLMCLVRFPSGATVCFETSWILPRSLPTVVDYCIELVGTKGAVYTDGKTESIQKYAEKAEFPRSFVIDTHTGKGIGFFYEQLYHFFDCVSDRSIKPICNEDDGYKNTELLVAALRSAKNRLPVKLPL